MRPLAGIRVLTFEAFGAGPFGSMYLADLGAEVIKVESRALGGDATRSMGPYFLGPNDSHFFQTFNLNKKSVTIDLKTAAGQEVFRRLAASASAVMNNLRGDQPRKLGLDYAALGAVNPRIVCAHLSAYGRDNERESWPGYDYLMQAEAGYLHLTGEPGSPPARMGLSIIDFMTGITTALALLAFVGLGWAGRSGRALVEHRVAYAYTLPAMLGMLVLVFFPFFYGIALSFTNANIYNTDKSIYEIWVGLQNYGDILSDFRVTKATPEGWVWNYQNFYYTLLFTVVWTVSNVTIGVTLGLILALILNLRGFALRPVYRVLLILPWAVPNYITSLIFRGMFHRQFGVVNQIIQLFGGPAIPWFDKPFTSFLAVLTTNGWLSFPFMMVISLGALQSIPADLYEAARVDGATRWQQFRSITLPSLRPALVPAVILSVIWTFNMFNVIYLVSAGQPAGSTEILITQSYKLAFEQYRYGYAAAYSTIIFLILLAYGTWQNRVTRGTEALA